MAISRTTSFILISTKALISLLAMLASIEKKGTC